MIQKDEILEIWVSRQVQEMSKIIYFRKCPTE